MPPLKIWRIKAFVSLPIKEGKIFKIYYYFTCFILDRDVGL